MNQLLDLAHWNYQDYLASDWWRVRASIAKEKAGYRCEVSGCNVTFGLNVHHKNYNRLGRELDEDLICVCEKCHEKIHSELKK